MRDATIGEEIFNSITHGVGALAALAGLIILEVLAFKSGNNLQIISSSIYGVFLFLLFLFSTLYHSIQAKKAKHILRYFDHIFIYLLIAGTYTPILSLVLKLNVATGIILLGIIWGFALAGILLKIFLLNKTKFATLDVLFYLIMGWFIIFITPTIYKIVNPPQIIMLIVGGLLYTIGTVFYRWQRLKFHHAYWHMFVLFGSLINYLVVIKTY